MNVQNFTIKKKKRENNPLLPSSLRGLIVGKSNSGKTVLLLNLLLRDGWLDYNNLLVFGNSLHQEEYQIIKKGFEIGLGKKQLSNVFKNQEFVAPFTALGNYQGETPKEITAEFYEDCDAIPDPKALDPKKKNLIILDDCYLGKQSKAGSYYSRGRHNNCDSLYISQNYFMLPRGSVRENSNIIILFPQNSKSVQHIYQDHCTDLPFEEFKELCDSIWKVKYNFLTIDLTSSPLNGKYRQNLESFYIPRSSLPPSNGMAFIDITDPEKREDIVKEYVQMRNEVKQRNENNKESNLLKEQVLRETARPLVEATEKSAQLITSALKPEPVQKNESKTLFEQYDASRNKDKYYSIYKDDYGSFVLGNAYIQIDADNNIKIGDETYPYSKGLWNLLMLNDPKIYTEDELVTYKKIVEETKLVDNPRNVGFGSKRTKKYKFLTENEPASENEGIAEAGASRDSLVQNVRERIKSRKEEKGTGIILPGDINSLSNRFRLVCAERAAGNIAATTPEIVAILDEFLRRKHITKGEYNAMCKRLGC